MKDKTTDIVLPKVKKSSKLVNDLFSSAGIPQEETKSKQSWSDVDAIYNTIASSIVEIGSNINDCIRIINQNGGNANNELVITVNGLTRDIEEFSKDLLKIKKRHEGFFGLVNDDNELALCLSVFNDYVILNDRFKAIIFQPILTITEFMADIKVKNEVTQPAVAN